MASLQDVKDELATHCGKSLTKLGFIALSAMNKAGMPCRSWVMSPWQSQLRSRNYSATSGRNKVAKLLLHLHSYLLEMTDVDLVDVESIGPESSMNQCNTALRRQIDCLMDGKSRFREPPTQPEPEPDEYDVIIDANNRFSVLFEKQWALEDHCFYLDEEVKMVPDLAPTLEERRYKTQAESNATRKKMGFPPKGEATTDSSEYVRIAKKAEQPDAIRILISKIHRPLFRWRREYLIPYREGRLAKEELTIVPLTLLGVYEQWYQKHKDVFGGHPPPLRSNGLDGVPRVWDGQPLWAAPEVQLGLQKCIEDAQ